MSFKRYASPPGPLSEKERESPTAGPDDIYFDIFIPKYYLLLPGFIFNYHFSLSPLLFHMRSYFLLLGISLTTASCGPSKEEAAPKPIASFSVPGVVDTNVFVQVTNHSSNATSYLWNWGDNSSPTRQEAPSHCYDKAGRFRLRLQVTGAGGTDTISQLIQVNKFIPPAIATIAGRYRGQLHFNFSTYDTSGYIPARSGVRDTTLELVILDAETLALLQSRAMYESSSQAWKGRGPARRNYLFEGGLGAIYTTIQVEQDGDSLYCDAYRGGHGGGTHYRFYARKLP